MTATMSTVPVFALVVLVTVLSTLVQANGNWTYQGQARKFNQGNEVYTAKFFNNVVKKKPASSVIMSPYSSLFLLAQLAMYASGQSLLELLNLYGFENKNEISSTIPDILKSFDDQEYAVFKIVTKSYANTKYSFKQSFKTDTKNYFKAEAENVDFSNSTKAAQIINNWVAENTNNKIQDLVPASLLTPATQAVLANAIYFRAEWARKFEPEDTKPTDFYTADGKTSRVDMMNMEYTFNYCEPDNFNAKALELSYVNYNFTFLIVLPNNKSDYASLLTKMAEPDAIGTIRRNLKYERVNVFLPKFETTTSIDLKDTLEKVGVKDIFTPGTTGLSGILENSDNLFVSSAIQKANIIVNEIGSEAAAGNALVLAGAIFNPGPPKEFRADHPFIYYLLFEGTPVFCGLYIGD